MAAKRKADVCKPSVHAPAPHGTKGDCPICGRRRCHGKARDQGRCRLFPIKGAMVCRKHGAGAPQVRGAAAAREQAAAVEAAERKAAALFAESPTVDHREAALAEVGARYHAVLWFRQEIASTTGDEPRKGLLAGLAVREKRLDEILRLCHDMKIDQQMQDLAMRDADRMDLLVHSLLGQLGHDPQDPTVRQAVRAALTLVEGGAAS